MHWLVILLGIALPPMAGGIPYVYRVREALQRMTGRPQTATTRP